MPATGIACIMLVPPKTPLERTGCAIKVAESREGLRLPCADVARDNGHQTVTFVHLD